MTITNLDQLIAAMPGQHRHFNKASLSGGASSQWWSVYNAPGNPGAPGAPPSGSGEVPTNASPGSLFNFTNPTPPAQSSLAQADYQSVRATLGVYVDRLWHCSGVVANTTTAQVINSLPLTRPDSSGVGTELWFEVYTAPSTSRAFTVNYTNSDGVAKVSTFTTAASNPAGYAQPVPLNGGDKGVQSVQSITGNVVGGTAGNCGLSICRRLGTIIAPSNNIGADRDTLMLGMPRVYDDTCFGIFLMTDATISGMLSGGIQVVQG